MMADLSLLIQNLCETNCVLWMGNNPPGRSEPYWRKVLKAAVDSLPDAEEQVATLYELLEQDQFAVVYAFLAKSGLTEKIEAEFKIADEAQDKNEHELAAVTNLARLPWRTALVSGLTQLLSRGCEQVGVLARNVSLNEASTLGNDPTLERLVVSVPTIVRGSRRAPMVFAQLRAYLQARPLLMVGFRVGDPDFQRALDLLAGLDSLAPRFVCLANLDAADAIELEDRYGIEVIDDDEAGFGAVMEELIEGVRDRQSCSPISEPVDETKVAVVDMVGGLHPRADLSLDTALERSHYRIRELIEAVANNQAQTLAGLDPLTALRLGSLFFAHGQFDLAEESFQVANQVADEPLLPAIAEYNLAMIDATHGQLDSAKERLCVAMAADPGISPVPPRYNIEQIVAWDAFGLTLACIDRKTEKKVEVAAITSASNIGVAEHQRYLADVQRLVDGNFSGVQPIVEAFAEGSRRGVVNEVVNGFVLTEILEQEEGCLSTSLTLDLLEPVLKGMSKCHEAGVVHGHILPRNVVVSDDGTVLRGFGRCPYVSHARPSILRESIGFIAPEIIRGLPASPASDVYSMGALLYRCLTGRMMEMPMVAPSEINSSLDPRFDQLISESLNTHPERRPSMGELRERLAEYVNSPAIEELSVDDVSFDHGQAETDVVGSTSADRDRNGEPQDPEDWEGWQKALERNPNNLAARSAIDRMEQDARNTERWDFVAEILMVRAEYAQIKDQRVAMLRELAELFEDRLEAPGSAFETLQVIADDLAEADQHVVFRDMIRLTTATGNWESAIETLSEVAKNMANQGDRANAYSLLGKIFIEQFADEEQAIAAYRRSLEIFPDDRASWQALAELLGRVEKNDELAQAMLNLAQHESGEARYGHLLDAAEIFSSELGEHEEALKWVEEVITEQPDHARALRMADGLARALGRWDVVVGVLRQRADLQAPEEARETLMELAAISMEQMQDSDRALSCYFEIMEHFSADTEVAALVVPLLRLRLRQDFQSVTNTDALIDALTVLIESPDHGGERIDFLAECAELLDRVEGGAARAADYREQIINALDEEDPRTEVAEQGLEVWYENQELLQELDLLWLRKARRSSLEPEVRTVYWRKLHDLRKNCLEDSLGVRETLEALAELDSEPAPWREQLIENYLEVGDIDQALQVLDRQIANSLDRDQRSANIRQKTLLLVASQDFELAERTLLDLIADGNDTNENWELLVDIYERSGQNAKALDARVKVARTQANEWDQVRQLFEIVEELSGRDRETDRNEIVELLETIIQIDPNHQAATELYLQHLLANNELLKAWPIACKNVEQVRSQVPEDVEASVRILLLAGSCGLEIGETEKAYELFHQVLELDEQNFEVIKIVADMDFESGRWESAIKWYERQISETRSSTSNVERADMLVKVARAHSALGESSRAIDAISRGQKFDPDHEEAAKLKIEIVEAIGLAVDVVEAKLAYAKTIGNRIDLGGDINVNELREKQCSLWRDAAQLLVEPLNRPDEAAAQIDKILAFQPEDVGVLHQALDIYTTLKAWRPTVLTLERLAKLQDSEEISAKYLYTAGAIVRDEMKEPLVSVGFFKKVLELFPLHEKAFSSLISIFHAQGSWQDIAEVIRTRLDSLPAEGRNEERSGLCDQLANIYERHLDDPRAALSAYEQGLALSSVEVDSEVKAHRRRKVMGLALEALGDQGTERAISHGLALLALKPSDFSTYHRLIDLCLHSGRRDEASSVAKALRFFKQATPEELEIAGNIEDPVPLARGVISRELWQECLYHSSENARLSDLFGVIWPVVAARLGQSHSSFGVDRDQRMSVNLQSPGIAGQIGYACHALDVPIPDVFARDQDSHGFVVAALSDAKMVYPSLVAGAGILRGQHETASIFRCARAVARVQPEHILARVLPSGASLRDAVYGAVMLAMPGVAVPPESRELAKIYAGEFRRWLPPARIDHLTALASRVVEDGGADTLEWSRGVEFTATRVGFLLCGNLEISARVLSQATDEGSNIPVHDLVKDLVAFSVSEEYFRLRRALKFLQRPRRTKIEWPAMRVQ